MNLTQTGTLVAILVGIYGAMLSTFLFFRERRRDRRAIRVICEKTLENWPDGQYSPIRQYEAITVRAVNTGQRPVVVVAAGFYLSNGETIEKTGEAAGLPKKVEDGESVAIPFGVASLEKYILESPQKPGGFGQAMSTRLTQLLRFRHAFGFQAPIYVEYVLEDASEGRPDQATTSEEG